MKQLINKLMRFFRRLFRAHSPSIRWYDAMNDALKRMQQEVDDGI